MKGRVVYINELPPTDIAHEYVTPPKGNDRMWKVTLFNRGRRQEGTLTIWRMTALFRGIKKRYGKFHQSKSKTKPVVIRARVAGPIIAKIVPLEEPVASLAVKH